MLGANLGCFSHGDVSVMDLNKKWKVISYSTAEKNISEPGLRGRCFQKPILVWKFSCISKNGHFCQGAILLYKQFIHLTQITLRPQHTVFEYSAACLSFIFELLPGLIPFAILWHTG